MAQKKRVEKKIRESQLKKLLDISEENEVKCLKFARDAMIKPVFLFPEDNTKQIMNKLRREKNNVCIVISKDKEFIGEIGENDLIKLFLDQVKSEPLVQFVNIGYRREFLYKKARELINKHKSTVHINDPINKVIKLIYKEGFSYIPVLNDNKKVVGVITPSSLINLLKNK